MFDGIALIAGLLLLFFGKRLFWMAAGLVAASGPDRRGDRVNPGGCGLRLGIDIHHSMGRCERSYLRSPKMVNPEWYFGHGDLPGINGGGNFLAGIQAAKMVIFLIISIRKNWRIG